MSNTEEGKLIQFRFWETDGKISESLHERVNIWILSLIINRSYTTKEKMIKGITRAKARWPGVLRELMQFSIGEIYCYSTGEEGEETVQRYLDQIWLLFWS